MISTKPQSGIFPSSASMNNALNRHRDEPINFDFCYCLLNMLISLRRTDSLTSLSSNWLCFDAYHDGKAPNRQKNHGFEWNNNEPLKVLCAKKEVRMIVETLGGRGSAARVCQRKGRKYEHVNIIVCRRPVAYNGEDNDNGVAFSVLPANGVGGSYESLDSWNGGNSDCGWSCKY